MKDYTASLKKKLSNMTVANSWNDYPSEMLKKLKGVIWQCTVKTLKMCTHSDQ